MNEKVYIAVEMTKLFIKQENDKDYNYSKEQMMNVYNYFFDKLKHKE